MKKLSFFLWIVLTVFTTTNCSTSKKTLQRGEYYKATLEAVSTLRSSPGNKKAAEVLLQSYPLAKENSLRKIQNVLKSNSADRYLIMADEYLALNTMADEIYTCPKALELLPHPEEYSKELGEILPLAAGEAYRTGERLLQLNTIQDAREAYFFFEKADLYQPGFRDVKSKIMDARFAATLKVVVQQPVTPENYKLTAGFFYNNLMAEISKLSQTRFIRFYTPEEAQNEQLNHPDQYLILDFADFSVGNIKETKNTKEISRDSVLVGTTTVDGKKHDVYGKVKANFTTNRREVISQGILSVRILNAFNQRVEEHRSLPGKFVWFNEWASFNGDERALSEEQAKMAKSEPAMPPPQQELFMEFTKPIFNQATSYVRNYYTRYDKKLDK